MTVRRDVHQMREVEEALRRSEAKYRQIFEKIQDIFFQTDDQGLIVEASPSVQRYGYTREELIGMPAARVYEDPSKRITLLQLLEDGDITDREVRLKTRDGRVVDFSISAHMLRGPDGSPAGMEGCLRDISDRKRAEEALRDSEEEIRAITHAAMDAIIMIDNDGSISYWNPAAERLFGHTAQEALGKELHTLLVPQEHHPSYGEGFSRFQTTGQGAAVGKTLELSALRKDGTEFPIELSLSAVHIAGTWHAIGIVRDISDRKRAEEALRRSERELAIRNKIADIFLTVPDEEMYGEALQVVLETLESRHGIFGYIDEDGALVCASLTRDVWEQCRVPDKDIVFPRERWGGNWGRALTEKKSLYSNAPGRVPEGHIPILNALAVPIIHRKRVIGLLHVANKETGYDDNDQRLLETIAGHIAPILHARLQRDRQERRRRLAEEELRRHRDRLEELVGERTAELTQANERLLREMEERRQAGEALRESEAKLKQAQVLGRIGSWGFDVGSEEITWSDQTYRLYDRDPALGPPTSEEEATYYSQEQALKLREYARCAIEEGKDFKYDFGAELPSGRRVFYTATMHPIKDVNGRVVKLFGTVQDITERRTSEEVLREGEERFRAVVENAPFGYYRVGNDGLWQYVNPVWERMHGYSLDDVIGKSFEITQTREDVEGARQKVKRALAGETITGEFSRTTRQGTVEHHTFNIQPVRQGNEIVAIEGFINDTTERRQAEEALRRSEQRFSKAFHASPLAIVVATVAEGQIVDVNEGFLQPMGYSREEAVGRTTVELGIWADGGERERMVREVLKRGSIPNWELRVRTRSGETRFWLGAFVTIELDGVPCLLGMSRDITEHRQAEEALRESEQRFRQVLDVSSDMIYWLNLESKTYEYVSPSSLPLSGFTPKEFAGLGIRGIRHRVHPDDWPQYKQEIDELLGHGARARAASQWEFRWRRKDGEYRWFSESRALVRDEDGRPLALVGTIRDTTERRQAEEALRESERRFRQVLDVSSDMIYKLDLESDTFDYISPSALEMTGFTPEESIAMGPRGLSRRIHPGDWPDFKRGSEEFVEFGSHPRFEYRLQCKDGEYRWLNDNRALVRGESGRPLALVGTVRDVTKRRQAEEALRESEGRFRTLSASAPIGIFLMDDKGNIIYANERLQAIGGPIPQGSRNIDFMAVVHPDDRERVLVGATRQQEGPAEDSQEFRILTPQGETRWVHLHARPILSADGRQSGVVGIVEDITERRQAEEALRESEERFRTLSAAAPIGIMLIDNKDGLVYYNERLLAIYGLPLEGILGFGWVKYVHPDDREALLAERSEAMAEGREFVREFRIVNPQGVTRWVRVRTTTVSSQEGMSNTRVGTVEDITERRMAEEALRESEERFRQVLDVSSDMIYKLDLESDTFDYISPSVLQLTGFTPQEVIDMGPRGVFHRVHPEDWQHYKRDLEEFIDLSSEARRALRMEFRWQCKDGEYRWFADSRAVVRGDDGRPLAVVGTIRDTTERRKAEEQARQLHAEHVRANELRRMVRILEQMAATLGHELRNPLGVIGNSVYFLANQAHIDGPKAQQHVLIIGREVAGARRVIDDILEFAHVPQLLPAAASINAIVDSALARSQIPANIRVVRKLAVDLPPLICDEERLERAFIDIITNAVQAMPHGGRLGVKTARSGDEIEVVFSDSGVGIAPENLDKVFDPMFTTKLRGIGLGLTVVRRTVEQHGGGISVRSRLGRGAVFAVALPRDCRPLDAKGGRVA